MSKQIDLKLVATWIKDKLDGDDDFWYEMASDMYECGGMNVVNKELAKYNACVDFINQHLYNGKKKIKHFAFEEEVDI